MNIVSIGKCHLTDAQLNNELCASSIRQIPQEDLPLLEIQESLVFISQVNTDSEMSKIYRDIREKDWSVPILFFSEKPQRVSSFIECDARSFCFSLSQDVSQIKEVIRDIVSGQKESTEYIKAPIRSLFFIENSPVDLYLKLSANKMIKIVNKGTTSLSETLAKYEEKNCEFVYTTAKEYPELVSSLASSDKNPIWESMNAESKAMFARDTFDFVHHSLHMIGLDEKTLMLTNHLIKGASQFIKSSKGKEFKKVWGSIVKGQNYLVEHSLLLSYLVVGASKHLNCDTRDKEIKLLLASMFHDISLTSDYMAKDFGTEFQKDFYEKKYREEFESHHSDAVALISSIDGIPSDVDTILMQHHEKPDGKGFPRGLGPGQIHPLTALFIVAHDLTQNLYNHGFSIYKRNELLRDLHSKYSEGFYRQALVALEVMFGMDVEVFDIEA